LATFRELDHYPHRTDPDYCGVWSNPGGATSQWPAGMGKRVFAYLKPFQALPSLLDLLNQLRYPAVVYMDSIDPGLEERFRSPTLHFEHQRVNLAALGRQCDLAILNGGHGATAAMLLAGRPILQTPLHLEQALTGATVARLQAGLVAQPTKPEHISANLVTLLHSHDHTEAARRFADRYADFNAGQQIEQIVQRLEQLL